VPQKEKTIQTPLEDNEFELPIGIEINGELHKTVKMTEMTGATEEAIADPKVRSNGGKIITEALFGVTEKIGTLSNVKRDYIRDMTSADRDFMLLMNHKVSVGDEIEYEDECPKCAEKSDVKVNIDNIPVTYMKKEEPKLLKLELPNGVKDAEGKVYKKITLSLPTGRSQEQIFSALQQNPNQAVTLLLNFITEDIEGLSHWNPDTFRNMTKKDRKFISQELGKIEVGADLSPKVTCASCGHVYESTIPVRTLLGE
jgi:hypothetical protein